MKPARITLDGTPLAANGVSWQFATGVEPSVAKFSVTNDVFDRQVGPKLGQPMTLRIVDARGAVQTISKLYPLHKAPSDKPSVTSFLVADLRWLWNRRILVRDYNIPRRTGDTGFDSVNRPIEAAGSVPRFDFRGYTLRSGDEVWTAKQAVEDALEAIVGDSATSIDVSALDSIDEQFTLQNVALRDPGGAALRRLLTFIPGADVWVDAQGVVKIINTLDVQASREHYNQLPPDQWGGEKVELIDRRKIRPSKVRVFYEREVEVLLEYKDDLRTQGGTTTGPGRNDPYCENVVQTVDPVTTLSEFDPELGRDVEKRVPPGSWVDFAKWLEAMDDIRTGRLPWTFNTIRLHWIHGSLEGVLVPTLLRGVDLVDDTNEFAAVAQIRQHFRRSYRISRRYVERVKSIRSVRAALVDPVTGARQNAAVWGQLCATLSVKGYNSATRKDPNKAGLWYNLNALPPAGEDIAFYPPGPEALTMIDEGAGIFRLDAYASRFGEYDAIYPGFSVEDGTLNPGVPTRDLSRQDDSSVAAAMRVSASAAPLISLSPRYEFKAMVTMVPGSPNSKLAMHVEEVDSAEIADWFTAGESGMENADGPPFEVYVPMSEMTARFAWTNDDEAKATLAQLLGLDSDDPTSGGVVDDPDTPDVNERIELPGYTLVNAQRELHNHARAVAAEVLSSFADAIQGSAMTRLPNNGVELVGNLSRARIAAAAAPSGKVAAMHDFPGVLPIRSRLAFASEPVRKFVLGIVRFR